MNLSELARYSPQWPSWVPNCANLTCRRNRIWQTVWGRREGVSISEDWYCSADCFEEAIEAKFTHLLSARDKFEETRRARMPLGLLLVSRGVMTGEQLRTAVDRQSELGVNMGEVVQQLGFASQEQVTSAAAAQWGYPVFSIRSNSLPFNVRIPKALLELYGILPVHFVEAGRKLMMGCVRGVHHQVLHMIEQMTACSTIPCFIAARQFEMHLPAFLRGSANQEVTFERTSSSLEMARIARNYLLQLGADQVRFGICRDYLWTRFSSRTKEFDLLFRQSN
jgi:hypothetical protein